MGGDVPVLQFERHPVPQVQLSVTCLPAKCLGGVSGDGVGSSGCNFSQNRRLAATTEVGNFNASDAGYIVLISNANERVQIQCYYYKKRRKNHTVS